MEVTLRGLDSKNQWRASSECFFQNEFTPVTSAVTAVPLKFRLPEQEVQSRHVSTLWFGESGTLGTRLRQIGVGSALKGDQGAVSKHGGVNAE